MLRDPFAPPPAPRPMRLSELTETDVSLVTPTVTDLSRFPGESPAIVPAWIVESPSHGGRLAWAIELALN